MSQSQPPPVPPEIPSLYTGSSQLPVSLPSACCKCGGTLSKGWVNIPADMYPGNSGRVHFAPGYYCIMCSPIKLPPDLPPVPVTQSSFSFSQAGTPAGPLARKPPVAKPAWAAPDMGDEPEAKPLPRRTQEEPVRGVKCAILKLKSETTWRPEAVFRGMGYSVTYDIESYAICGENENHPVPSEDCSCGFWLPDSINGVQSGQTAWLLDVEIAGELIRHERGWRGEWQRVLAVQPPLFCPDPGHTYPRECVPATCLIISGGIEDRIHAVCREHAGQKAVPKPVSWLRSLLRTELKPGFLSDDPVLPASASLSEAHLQQMISGAVAAASSAAVTPGLVPGREWKYAIVQEEMVLTIRTTTHGLVLCLDQNSSGGWHTLWTENMPL